MLEQSILFTNQLNTKAENLYHYNTPTQQEAFNAASQDAFSPSKNLSTLSMHSANSLVLRTSAQGIVNTRNILCLLTETQNAD